MMPKNKQFIIPFLIIICIFIIMGIVLLLLQINKSEQLKEEQNSQTGEQFRAKIIEVLPNGNLLVEPNAEEQERKSSDKISVNGNPDIQWKVGMEVIITYGGEIMESYPARIIANDIQIYKKSDLTITSITDDEAKVELEKDSSIVILDVRTKEEYDEKHITNSILIPLNELENRAVNELKDKQVKIFVYCRSGVRSVTASEILVKLGYENVYNLGGIIDWKYETE